MDRVLFSKFSKDRQKEFQISTSVIENEKGRFVVKEAVHEEGLRHIQKLGESWERLKELYGYKDLKICPCRIQGNRAVFPYVEGDSMEDRIQKWGERKDFSRIKEEYKNLYEILFSAKGLHTFQNSEGFRSVFGEVSFSREQTAGEISNIDMIPSNLLVGDGYTVIDYEWVFDFEIPVEFIYARSVFLQEAAARLQESQKKELYQIAGIEWEDVPLYYQMEVNFQEYAAGRKEKYALSKLYADMHRGVYPVEQWDYQNQFFSMTLEGLKEGKWREIFYRAYGQREVKERIRIETSEKYEKFRLSPLGKKGLLKLKRLTGKRDGKWEQTEFSDNSRLIILDDYYFLEKPVFEFSAQEYSELAVEYFVYSYDDGILDALVSVIEKEARARERNQALEAENKSLQEGYNRQKERLERLEGMRAYQLYQKLKKWRKRGN